MDALVTAGLEAEEAGFGEAPIGKEACGAERGGAGWAGAEAWEGIFLTWGAGVEGDEVDKDGAARDAGDEREGGTEENAVRGLVERGLEEAEVGGRGRRVGDQWGTGEGCSVAERAAAEDAAC